MKMRKLLLAAVAAALLSGCLKSTETTSKLKPVAPGLEIYSCANTQTQMALLPAATAVRLAMLLAEAEKQDKTEDLDNVSIDGVRVKYALFGAETRITKTGDGYRIVYSNSCGATNDRYRRSGTVTVRTDGVGQLAETESAHRWIVKVEDVLTVNPSAVEPLYIAGGTTSIYRTGDVYRIEVGGFEGYFTREIPSNWNCEFDWRPADAQLAYSACRGKESTLVGEGSGASFYMLNSLSVPTHMRYRVSDGRYLASGYIASGTERGWLTSMADYDINRYPSSEVTVVWSYEGGRVSYVVTYNGNSASSN